MAQEAARFALLIGNKGYSREVGPLVNPHTDVDLVAAALKKLGFTPVVLKDATYKAMDSGLKRHVETVRRAGAGAVSFFYYSGHGAANGETRINYLVPVDVADADDDRLWYESFQHNATTDMLTRQAPNALHYMVLDACRNELNLTKTGKKSLGTQKGFVPVEYTSGVLIAYATAPGKTAEDGKPGGGPYARALADEIVKSGVEAYTMFRNVGLRVKGETGQDPWLSSSTLPEVYLAGRAAAVAPVAPPPAPAAPAQQSAAAEAWVHARETTSIADLETFIRRFGDTYFGDLAKRRLVELKSAAAAEQQRLARIMHQT